MKASLVEGKNRMFIIDLKKDEQKEEQKDEQKDEPTIKAPLGTGEFQNLVQSGRVKNLLLIF